MACKYTYGNQVYDSLDDLKAAVKNDLQRSADKEDVGLSAHPVTKIISGAQTGVDMAGLDAGKEIGIPTGGTAAAKFQQSVGEKQKEFKPELANIYGLKEGKVTKRFTQDGRQYDDVYYQRTLDNAQEADGTIWFGNAGSPGGKLTLGKDAQKGKPAPLVNPTSAQEIRNWLNKHNIKTLNVAGNREYTNPGIYDKAKTLLVEALKSNIVDNTNQSNTTQQPKTEAKITVEELFESNPELANSVYEVMGFEKGGDNYYEGNIKPEPDTIFVFGSNPEGRHGAGAAKIAVNQFGAKYGQGEGLQGNAYALPTKDLRIKENNGFKSISPKQITENIKKLYEVARQNPDKQFKIGYRNTTEKSLNGYTGLETLEMFNDAGIIPTNIIFSKEWINTGKLNNTNQITLQQKQQAQQKFQEYINVTGKQDIEGFKDFVQGKPNSVKPGVEELFNENPELANNVYEALEFTGNISLEQKQQAQQVYSQEITDEFIENNLKEKKYQSNAQGWYILQLPNYLDNNLINKQSVEYAKTLLNLIEENNLTKNDGYQLSDKFSKILNKAIPYLNDISKRVVGIESNLIINGDIKPLGGNKETKTLEFFNNLKTKSFIEIRNIIKGFAEYILNPEFSISKQDKEKTIILLNDFITKYDENNLITLEQKQQAQQVYSQYLNTIFPYSKVKDIVYHGSNQKIEQFEVRKEPLIHFGTKNAASQRGNVLNQAILNIKDLQTIKDGMWFLGTDEGGLLKELLDRNILTIEEVKSINEVKNKAIQQSPYFHENYRMALPDGEKAGNQKLLEILKDKNIGFEYINKSEDKGSTSYAVSSPEQIHILGSKQDIQGFKEFAGQSFTNVKSGAEAKITDVEVEAMTEALVEMYPEIEFGIENNPNFVDREGVFNQRIENEMDRDYWRDLYRNTYTKNQQEFRLMSIPTIADKYEPDTEHVYHGTKNYKIDSEGNLILVPSENYSGKTTSISFTQIPVVAQDYMIRKRGNIIIKIDNDVLGDDYEVESAEEIAVNGNKLFIVPKGKYTIITVPRLNELREVEVGKQIDKKANKLLSTISDDLALLDTIYAAQIEAKNYSEFQEQTDNPNKIVDSLYLDERYVASAAGTQIYEQVASKVDKQWIITALSNKLIDDIENTGKTISNIEDALWDMSRYGEDYAPHTSNLFEELLNHIGLGYNAAFGVSENATKESILLQQEKQKEREEIVDKIEELVNKADEKALAVYNSEEEVAKRKERKLLRDTARAKYLSLAENQVKQEMPDDLPFQKIQKDGKSKIIGQADIQARKVLIDAAFKNKPDLVSHEFAHHYIAWFRNTPLVQQGIKMYGSEEELVEAIGKQAVVQRGKAWSWWKKFVAWLLNSANDVSDLTKENLRDILTDAFLSRQDLNKQAGTEAGVKLEKNVAVLGGETYLWNDNTGSWQPFTKSEADIEYSNDEMQKLMQEERDAKAQVKNDPVITPSWQTNTKEQLENRLLNTHKAIALNKANRYNLFASINTNETKRITDKDNLNISAKQKNKGSIVDPLTNLIAAIVMVGSKQGVGNLANVISARALLMFVNAHSNNTFKYSVGADAVKKEAIPIFLTPFGISKQDFQNLGDPNYSFGSLIDGDNRSVMFNSSEQITNEVDAVKNPVAIHLGYSQQNLNLIGYLTSLHITPEKIFTFLGERDSSGINFKSNNVTNKWALYVATNENMFHSGKTYTTEVEHEDYASGYNYTEYRKNQIELANNKLKQQFIADLLKEEANKFVRPDVSVTNYFEDIKNDEGRVVGTKLKYAEIERDGLTNQLLNNKVLKILYYWDLIEQAKQFMKSGKVIIADSHYSKSMNDALLQADSVEEQLNGKDISVISNSDLRGIIEGDQSIVSGFFSAQSKYKTYFLKYFFGHESIISRYLNDQLKLRYNKTSKEDLERLMNRAYSDLLVNILFKMQVIDPSISQGVFPKDSSGNTLTPEAMLHSKPASSNTKSTVYNIYRTLKQISGTTGKAQVLPKYSGITKSMATALLDILQFQLGVDGNRMASEDKVNKGEVVPADLVKLAEKVSNSATANNYIELFEEVKQLAPELFKEFTMISLYQAGFNNSPYNLFKAMPNTASTNDGIIDATAKATDAYSKFIKSVAKQLKQDSDLTQAELETDLHKEVVDEFLRWYDSQYGHFVAQDKNRAMFNDNTPIYRMYNSKAQKFDLYVIGARGFNETGTKIANRVAGAKNTVDFTKTVDPKYNPVAATVNDLASLGVLGEDAKVLIDNGIEVTKLCN